MKAIVKWGLVIVMALGLIACSKSGEKASSKTDAANGGASDTENGAATDLNIMMWGDYISENLVSEFEKANKVKINFTYMSDNADAVNKLTAGGGNEFDLILTCDAYMEALIKGGYVEKLDLSKLPNSKNLNTTYWHAGIKDYCIPYLMNYVYVVYDTKRCPIEITCYNDLVKPEMKGQLGSIDGARNLFPVALVALGYDPNSRDEKEIAEAYEWLKKFHENTVAYGNTQENIISGMISAMLTYDGNAAWAMEQLEKKGENTLKIAEFKKDPVQLGMDLYVIPTGAKHQDMAYKFLDYILDADVMAKNLDEFPYSCPNDAAIEKASETYRNGPAFDFDYKDRIFFQEDVGEAIKIYDSYFQKLKAGQ